MPVTGLPVAGYQFTGRRVTGNRGLGTGDWEQILTAVIYIIVFSFSTRCYINSSQSIFLINLPGNRSFSPEKL
jgi:hypothetical protein